MVNAGLGAHDLALHEITGEVFSNSANLMHSFMQHRDDTDILVGEAAPINKVALVAEKVALDAEFSEDV